MVKQSLFSRMKFWGKKKSITFQQFFGGNVPPAMTASEQLASYAGWAYASIKAVAEDFSNIDLHLYNQNNKGEFSELEDHEILNLLNRPNDFQTKREFLQLFQIYKELTGEVFVYLERGVQIPTGKEKPKSMWLLRPDLVDVVPDEKNFIKGYIYRLPGKAISFQPFEIIHFKYPNPLNPYRGYSPMKAGALALDTSRYVAEWNRNFFFNAGRPDGVLTAAGQLTDDQVKRLRTEWDNFNRGVKNSQRTAILEGGIEYTQLGTTLKDMDFSALKDKTRDEIISLWNVPKVRLGISETETTRATAEAGDYVFTSRVIKPKMQDLVDVLNEVLVPLFGNSLVLDFDDPTPEDRLAEVNEYVNGINRWLTINEVRGLEGLDPVDGGDVIYQQISLLPIGSADTGAADQNAGKGMVIKLQGKKFVDVRIAKKFAKFKLVIARRKKSLVEKVGEAVAKNLQLVIKAKQSEDAKKEASAEREASLLNENEALKTERDFHKAEAEKNLKLATDEGEAKKVALAKQAEAEKSLKDLLDADGSGGQG